MALRTLEPSTVYDLANTQSPAPGEDSLDRGDGDRTGSGGHEGAEDASMSDGRRSPGSTGTRQGPHGTRHAPTDGALRGHRQATDPLLTGRDAPGTPQKIHVRLKIKDQPGKKSGNSRPLKHVQLFVGTASKKELAQAQ